MSDRSNNSMETVSFRRFLSYIYAYEDDTKLRNVGFAKVEVRSQRVRIQVSVNGIFQKGGRPMELCLVDGNLNRIPVGQVMFQNGRGEYRGSSNTEDLWDTGISFSQVYGICLQGAGNKRHYYMTLWREIARPAKVSHNQIVVIPRNREQENSENQMVHAAEAGGETEKEEVSAGEIQKEREISVGEIQKEREISVGGIQEEREIPVGEIKPEKEDKKMSAEEIKPEREEKRESEGAVKSEKEDKRALAEAIELKKEDKRTSEGAGRPEKEDKKALAEELKIAPAAGIVEALKVEESAEEQISEESEEDLQEQLESASELLRQQSTATAFDEGVSEKGRQQNRRGKKEDKRMELWKRFCSRYPHVDIRPDMVEDGGNGFSETGRLCEVLRIRPNDIGRLPRNNWILAHNSFLQHSYNHSHQLILFRVETPNLETSGENHWFIGLPGEKSEQETLVAEVFGFKKFLPCKKGGFWYTEIYMGVY